MVVKTEINIGTKSIPIEFSFMTIREIEKAGYSLPNLQDIIKNEFSGLLIELIKAGAKVARRSADEVLSDYDVADWVNEHGLMSEEVQGVFSKFTESISEGVPKNEMAVKPQRVKKATPQK